MLYIVKSRSYYRDNKYQQVDDPSGDYEIIDRGDAKEVILRLLQLLHCGPISNLGLHLLDSKFYILLYIFLGCTKRSCQLLIPLKLGYLSMDTCQ